MGGLPAAAAQDERSRRSGKSEADREHDHVRQQAEQRPRRAERDRRAMFVAVTTTESPVARVFALTPVFADLNRYEATSRFNGQSTVRIDGNRARGESYTIAHHLFSEEGNRKVMIVSLRYLDTFAKIDGSWYFAERRLLLDWSETRPSTPGT
jgi:SnoaL-like domain